MALGARTGVPDDDQRELRRVVCEFLTRHSSEEQVRRSMTGGYEMDPWRRFGTELGLCGLAIPEKHGGVGVGYHELSIVFEEAGRALFCAPYFATIALAVEVLLHAEDEPAAAELLPALAAGERTATVAGLEPGGTAARRAAGEWLLDGVESYVLDGHTADLVLVFAHTDSGLSVFAVSADDVPAGLRRTAVPTMDQTRPQAELVFENVSARLIGAEGAADRILARATDAAAVLLAAEQLGGTTRALELAVEYAGVRSQYGRVIGSFQAVKHRLADMLVDVECARSAVVDAVGALAEDAPDLPQAAALAKAFCSEIYTGVAAGCIQVHGGIGFTWEHPAHLYFKRAKSSELLLGTPAYHRGRLAGLLGL
ncbi:acyl-CoA/acyl-ACP dehydrogenase [Nocardia vinacea]|uniref:Acyl-CoA/acyl-ACP dehydrogenase n=1 Tax=Nocardia vinacea TaxID=96468 RepID=A0ABZ1YQW6_9NOCA|nr:acyl-CoA dehydrogenase family protein [Nocardia vinacea]